MAKAAEATIAASTSAALITSAAVASGEASNLTGSAAASAGAAGNTATVADDNKEIIGMVRLDNFCRIFLDNNKK